jgi:hypothetical protein
MSFKQTLEWNLTFVLAAVDMGEMMDLLGQ